MNQLGDQEAQILAYSQAVKKLEAQLENRNESCKRKGTIAENIRFMERFFQESLEINSGMSSNSKVGLGFEIQSNNKVLSYEEEMNFSIFNCSKKDLVGKPLYSRFTKTSDFKGVPHPLSGDYTPTPQEELDESLYVYVHDLLELPLNIMLILNLRFQVYLQKCMCLLLEAVFRNEGLFNTGNEVANQYGPVYREIGDLLLRPQQVIIGGTLIQTPIVTDHPLKNMVDRGIFDSGCSGHMTGNKDQLEDFEEFNGGSVTFGGSKGYISGKGKIRVGNLDFDSVSFVKELGYFNLFSISQICDKQHKVLFTETECLVVSSDFKMPDENQILLKVPRHHNMYSFDMKTPTPAKGFACLIAKATSDESKLWHRRLGHINFKNLNKLVKGNLVRGTRKNGINHEYSNARTPQQNRVAERMNRTLIEAARTMLADSLLPTTFWAEVVTLEKSIDIPHAGASEVTNSAGTSQTPIFNAFEEKDEDKEEILTELQQEKKASSTNTSEDNPKILAFRRELEEIALKHLGKVSENTTTNIPSVNTGSEPVNTGSFDPDDSPMPELEIFHKSETGIFDEASYDEEGVITIDIIVYRITEASIRHKLQLADASGITMLPNNEIFERMWHMGYPTDGSFTFWKSFFTPQWRFLVHHILHCISSKSGGWDQFGSNIATALICLSTGRVYNFSKLIFDGMVANLKSKTKFLMYPRFLQLILEIQTENKHPYLAVTLTKKIFGNMKRGFRGAPRPLLSAMLLVATNPNAGQEHPDVAQYQPSSSTIPVPSTSLPPEQSTPPIPTLIPASTPTPIPETDPEPMEHTFKEPSPTHQHFSPPQEHAQGR
ncbi:ribonuclease H-like domain-containing protein [Tanacetum coccineum]